MDKFAAEQLNKAYAAFRLACMEREKFKKELDQKEELYEQQLREHKQQIESLTKYVIQLNSQLAEFTVPDVNSFEQFHSQLQNKDGWKSDTDSTTLLEILQKELRVLLKREKRYKEDIHKERSLSIKIEKERHKLLYALASKNEEIQHLKTLLKEANERREKQDSGTVHAADVEAKSKNLNPDLSAASVFSEDVRQNIERLFFDVREEFNNICKLSRKQSSLLNMVQVKREIASMNDTLRQFSMPIQCTDEGSQEAQLPQQPVKRKALSKYIPMTPRGLTSEDDLVTSVESLSNLSVKFPPNTDNSEFLQSSTEKPPVLPLVPEQNSNKVKAEAPPNLRKFSTAVSSPPYSPRSPKTVFHNVKVEELSQNYDSFASGAEEHSPILAASSPAGKSTNVFRMPDITNCDESIEVPERTVRGPQQPIWKPSSHQDNDPSSPVGEKWDQDSSDVCEFCQAVFPRSTRDKAEFLRHLNSHFNNLI